MRDPSTKLRAGSGAPADFNSFCGVGRKQLPTSIGGALVHVADHTQRHVGQVVTTAKVLKALSTQ